MRVTTAPPTADQTEGPDPAAGTGQLTSESSVEDRATAAAGKAVGRRTGWTPRRVDIAVCVVLTLAAVVLDHGLLLHPFRRVLALNPDDQALVEWLLALGTRFWTGDLDLVTHLLNAPDGVNLMSNASMLTLGVLLAPITFAFGAPVSFAVGLPANLAATAIGWYLLLARYLKLHRAAAATGAAFCAYAPGMIAQSNAHLHMTSQWLVPVIVVNAKPTPHTGPYRLLMGLPVIDGALPTRFALTAIPIIGYVLATALDRALHDDRLGVRLAVPTIIGLALLPSSRRRCRPRTGPRCPGSSSTATGAGASSQAARWYPYRWPIPAIRTRCAGRRRPTRRSRSPKGSSSGRTRRVAARRSASTPARPRACSATSS